MMKSISLIRIWAILLKEFIQLKRDRVTLQMIIGIPIMQLIIFGYAINSDPRYLPTAMVIQDNGIIARNIVSGLKNSEYFDFIEQAQSPDKAKQMLQEGEITFVITIPEDFSRNLIRKNKPSILIEADATDPIAISGALGNINTIIKQALKKDKYGSLKIDNENDLYEVRIHRKYNPEGLSRVNIVPGLIAIVLTLTCLTMTAISLTRERERGTMENLLAMPVKPIEVMLGKIAPYIAIGYIQALIIIAAAYFIFEVPIIGNLLYLALGLLIFIICNLALGFSLSTMAENQMQAMQSSVFLLLPSILLSGFMFPFRGMPEWAQYIGSVLPSTYFIRLVRGVMLKGSDFSEIWPHIWPLCIFMLVITVITMKVYRRTLD